MKKLSYNEFIFESNSRATNGFCNKIYVEIDPIFESSVEDCYYELSLYDETSDEKIELESLPENEQKEIESRAESMFSEFIDQEWSEYQTCRAEDWSDSREDR